MLCCQGFAVNHYDFTLGRLAYENLRSVQDKGNTLILIQINNLNRKGDGNAERFG